MLKKQMATLICLSLFMPFGTIAAEPVEAEVIHWWTSPGESAALMKLTSAFEDVGGIWIDSAIAGSNSARSTTINRILGGAPPTAALFNTSKQYHELIEAGLLNNIDDVAERENWESFLPAPVKKAIKVDGHYYAAPVNIHQPNWLWYSVDALKKAGIETPPNTFDAFMAQLAQLKQAGIIPLALGGQKWQEMILFSGIMLNMPGGTDLYNRIFADRDPTVFDSPGFHNLLMTFKKFTDYVDPGSPGRNWNDATNLLIKGDAAFQIMGDWVKGEFDSVKLQAGKDYGCISRFGKTAPYVIAGDVFIFPKNQSSDSEEKVQHLLASTFLNPNTQVAFSIRKGSIPVRSDVNANLMDICAQQGLEIMQDKSRHLAHFDQLMTPDEEGQVGDIISEFWNGNGQIEEVAKRLKKILTNG